MPFKGEAVMKGVSYDSYDSYDSYERIVMIVT